MDQDPGGLFITCIVTKHEEVDRTDDILHLGGQVASDDVGHLLLLNQPLLQRVRKGDSQGDQILGQLAQVLGLHPAQVPLDALVDSRLSHGLLFFILPIANVHILHPVQLRGDGEGRTHIVCKSKLNSQVSLAEFDEHLGKV